MGNRRERDLGPNEQVEGRHGDKTHSRLVEQLHETSADAGIETPDAPRAASAKGQPVVGHHRLHEDREQHDEAEKNSEKTRLARDVERHNHDVDPGVADSGSDASAKRKS